METRLLGATIAIIVSAVGIAITYRLPAVYQANALILVDPQKIPERFVASTVNTDVQDRLVAITQELLSSTRLQNIIKDFNLYPQERLNHTEEEVTAMMLRDIHLDPERSAAGNRPGAFRISYQNQDPSVVAKVVERITQFYIDENYRTREQQAAGTFDFMETQLRDAKKELDQQELALANYKLQHNGELPQQENSLNAMLARLQTELSGNEQATNNARQRKVTLENSLSVSETQEATLSKQILKPKPVKSAAAADDPGVEPEQPRARRASDDVAGQIASLKLRFSDTHPDVRRLQALYDSMRQREIEEEARQKTAALRLAAARAAAAKRNNTPVEDLDPDPLVQERAQVRDRIAALKAQLTDVTREIRDRGTERDRILRDMSNYQRRSNNCPCATWKWPR